MTDNPGWTPPVEPGDAATPAPAWTPQPEQQWGDQNSPWGAPPSMKPGVIPLRPLALGEILDGAFSVIREYPKVVLGLSAIVVVVTQVIAFAVQYSSIRSGTVSTPFGSGALNADRTLGFIVSAVGGLVLAGLLTAVMADAVLGRRATFGSVWARVRPRFWALLVASVVAGAAPFLGLFALLVPGIFLWGVWALVTPALVLERISIGAALRRSWRLALPDWWRVWGIRTLSVIIGTVLVWVIMIPFAAAAFAIAAQRHDLGVVPISVLLLGGIVAGTITTPFTSGVLSLLYIDRRMRAEGLDVTLAQAAAQQATRF